MADDIVGGSRNGSYFIFHDFHKFADLFGLHVSDATKVIAAGSASFHYIPLVNRLTTVSAFARPTVESMTPP